MNETNAATHVLAVCSRCGLAISHGTIQTAKFIRDLVQYSDKGIPLP